MPMLTCPVVVPVAVGVRATAIWHVLEGATLVAQLTGLP